MSWETPPLHSCAGCLLVLLPALEARGERLDRGRVAQGGLLAGAHLPRALVHEYLGPRVSTGLLLVASCSRRPCDRPQCSCCKHKRKYACIIRNVQDILERFKKRLQLPSACVGCFSTWLRAPSSSRGPARCPRGTAARAPGPGGPSGACACAGRSAPPAPPVGHVAGATEVGPCRLCSIGIESGGFPRPSCSRTLYILATLGTEKGKTKECKTCFDGEYLTKILSGIGRSNTQRIRAVPSAGARPCSGGRC